MRRSRGSGIDTGSMGPRQVAGDAGASGHAKQAGNKSEETEFAGKQGSSKRGRDECAGV